MEKSLIATFVKFFEGCIISKRIKKAERWLMFITYLLITIFWAIFTYVTVYISDKDLPNSIIVCRSIIFGVLLAMTIYFKESVLIVLLFPNEYFLMKSIKEYLGKIFRDIYLSDVKEEKILNHISTISYYIANLYNIQYIKSQNKIIRHSSSLLANVACKEFLYFLNEKLNVDGVEHRDLIDLKSDIIANIVFDLLKTEYTLSKTKMDEKLIQSLYRFLNDEIGKNFVKNYIVYNSITFDDYHVYDWTLYNKMNLSVIWSTPFYRRHIKDRNKEDYIIKKEKNKYKNSGKKKSEKPYLSWMDNL